MGLGADALTHVTFAIMETDATRLRLGAKARVHALSSVREMHELTIAELHTSIGKVALLSSLREQACTAEQLGADEYECAVEVDALRSTLDALAPRVAEAARLRLAVHAGAGALRAGQGLGVADTPELAAQLAETTRLAESVEPFRREERVLRGRLCKLEGRLQVLSALAVQAVQGVPEQLMRAEANAMLSATRLAHLRASMRAADLRLQMMRLEKAEANVHAAGAVVVLVKQRQLRLRDARAGMGAASSGADGGCGGVHAAPTAGSATAGSVAPVDPSDGGRSGAIPPEMRGFLRGTFTPMLRAAMSALIVRHPDEPLRFLADWLWQHSAANARRTDGAAYTRRDAQLRRRAIQRAAQELEASMATLASSLGAAEQAAGASDMLSRLLRPLGSGQILFCSLGDVSAAEASCAWSVRHASADLDTANSATLDAVTETLRHYPRALLQVHVPLVAGVALPLPLALALRLEPDATGALPDDQVREGLARLAWRRAEAIVAALAARGIPPRQMVGTAPGHDLGMQSAGMWTWHELPDALETLHTNVAYGSGGGTVHRPSSEALAMRALRERRERALADARMELSALQEYGSRVPHLALPQPLTLVASVEDVRLTAPRDTSHGSLRGRGDEPLVSIAFGTERASERVAAFEAVDLTVDEIEIEVWQAQCRPPSKVAGGAVAPTECRVATQLLGSVTLGIAPLLLGESPHLEASLPVMAPGNLTIGSVHVRIEPRRPNQTLL